ncbi:hypothetical protein ACJX0J_012080 [Zea mays]
MKQHMFDGWREPAARDGYPISIIIWMFLQRQEKLAQARDHLSILIREEEMFSLMIANGKHRKKIIYSLDQEEGKIEGQDNLKSYISDYYKELFGEPKFWEIIKGDLILNFGVITLIPKYMEIFGDMKRDLNIALLSKMNFFDLILGRYLAWQLLQQ